MSIVILNRVSKNKKNYIEWLKKAEEQIYILNHPESANSFKSDNAIVKEFSNYSQNGLVDYEVIEIHKKNPIKALIALEEGEIIRAGYLREYLGIKGQKLDSALHFRDKYLMKLKLNQNGIKVPPFRKIDNKTDLIDFIRIEGYPILIKPLSSWSSKGIQIIRNDFELKQCLLTNPLENHMVEKYLTASVYHVDGLIVNNNIEFICSSAYINTPLAYKDNIGFGSVLFEKGNKLGDQLIEFVRSALSKMPLAEDMSFHVEVFHDNKNNEFLICEMGSRTIGAGTDEIIKHTFNLDLDKLLTQAMAQVNLDFDIHDNNVSGQLFLRPKRGFLQAMPKTLPFNWCFKYEIRGIVGEFYEGAAIKPTDSYAVVYFEGKDQSDLLLKVKEIEDYMNENTVWYYE
jgi:ATP-grasp domain